jgi:hypothetical protein
MNVCLLLLAPVAPPINQAPASAKTKHQQHQPTPNSQWAITINQWVPQPWPQAPYFWKFFFLPAAGPVFSLFTLPHLSAAVVRRTSVWL